jgi:PPOX class probable F420-dependent enzyme
VLEPHVRDLASGPNFAALSTLLPDGSPLTHVMWVTCDDDHLYCNTEVHRQKFRNIRRDPRVSVAIWRRGNPYEYAEVRGRVVDTITGPEALALINELSRKYDGHDYDESRITSERVILKIAPGRQVHRADRPAPPR